MYPNIYQANPHDLALVGLSRKSRNRLLAERLGRAHAVQPILARSNLGSANTDRNASPNIWADCPWNALQEGSVSGVTFYDDFESFPVTPNTTEGNWGRYAQFGSTGATITAGTGQGGEIVIGSDDDNEGIGIRTLATPFLIQQGKGKLWFEARIKLSTIANTTFEFFIGLMENTALTAAIPITATAATLADKNLVGLYRTESAGSTGNSTYKCDGVTAVTVGSAEITFVASTYIKLGFVFDPISTLGTNYLTFYSNNLKLASSKQIPSAAGTDFPNDIGLGPCLATRNAAGSSPGTATIDWWRAAQLI